MSARNSDRNLLFGILALQMDFISRESLVKAMNDWVLDKEKPLGEILLVNEALSKKHREVLEQMVEAHVEAHCGDPEKSLASISSADSIRSDLEQIDATEVAKSLMHLSISTSKANSDETVSYVQPSVDIGEQSSLDARFQIIRPHAEGGLGKVSVAMDRELNREVALKEIKEGYSHDDSARTRFTLEAEITGGLEHPGIVPVYGLGYRDDGQPFYAMRFIKGDSLKDACAKYHAGREKRTTSENALEFRKLLGRFIDVCNAIEYAHSRGVLHRDLKPGNVMLGKYGETLVVDWGLAKAVQRDELYKQVDETTLKPSVSGSCPETMVGQAIGTPQFMSPEQAAGKLDALGTASDIYSLGATLFYLLTNRMPFADKNVDLLLAKVQNGDFLKPRALAPMTPSPLEAICVKAMSRKPENRYATPGELALEVERWLADEPVDALPESLPLRASRWLRKHQTEALSGVAIAVVVSLALSAVTYVVTRSNHRLSIVNNKLDETNKELQSERNTLAGTNSRLEVAIDGERKARTTAESVLDYMVDVFRASDPWEQDEDVLVRDVLEMAVMELDQLNQDPIEMAAIQQALGRSYLGLGDYRKANMLLSNASDVQRELLGEENPDYLFSMIELAKTCQHQSKYSQVLEILSNVKPILSRIHGPKSFEVLQVNTIIASAMIGNGDYPPAASLMLETVRVCQEEFGEDNEVSANALSNLAVAHSKLGDWKESLDFAKRALNVARRVWGTDSSYGLIQLNNLAMTFQNAGLWDEAVPLLRMSLDKREARFGPSHIFTVRARDNLAGVLQQAGKLENASSVFRESAKIKKAQLGPLSAETLAAERALALSLEAESNFTEALEVAQNTYDKCVKNLGDANPDTGKSALILAEILVTVGDASGAIQLLKENDEALFDVIENDKSTKLTAEATLATALHRSGKLDDALETFASVYRASIETYGAEHPTTLILTKKYADALGDGRREMEALDLLGRASEDAKRGLGEGHRLTIILQVNYAVALFRCGRRAEALELASAMITRLDWLDDEDALASWLRLESSKLFLESGKSLKALQNADRALQWRVEEFGYGHPATMVAVNTVSTIHLQLGHARSAIALLQSHLPEAIKELGEDHREVLTGYSNFAAALRVTGQLTRSLEILEDVYRSRELALGKQDPDTLSTMQNLAVVLHLVRDQRALKFTEECVQRMVAKFGNNHAESLTAQSHFGEVLMENGFYDRAEEVLAGVYERRKSLLGHDHKDVLLTLNKLAGLNLGLGNFDASERMYEEVIDRRKELLGDYHRETLNARANLAQVQNKMGRTSEAISSYELVIKDMRAHLDRNDLFLIRAILNRCSLLADTPQAHVGVPEIQAILDTSAGSLGFTSPLYVRATLIAAVSYKRVGDLNQAISVLESLVEHVDPRKQIRPDIATCVQYLGILLEEKGDIPSLIQLQIEFDTLIIYQAAVLFGIQRRIARGFGIESKYLSFN